MRKIIAEPHILFLNHLTGFGQQESYAENVAGQQ
jgi:hypothetical protein